MIFFDDIYALNISNLKFQRQKLKILNNWLSTNSQKMVVIMEFREAFGMLCQSEAKKLKKILQKEACFRWEEHALSKTKYL